MNPLQQVEICLNAEGVCFALLAAELIQMLAVWRRTRPREACSGRVASGLACPVCHRSGAGQDCVLAPGGMPLVNLGNRASSKRIKNKLT